MPTTIVRRYTTIQLVAMTEERLAQVIAADYNALVAVAINSASRSDSPPHIARLLRSPEWRFAWLDALTCAENTLQVSYERMTYEGDSRSRNIRTQLYGVRTALREARTLARQEQRLEVRDVHELDVENTATRWLAEAFQDQYKEIRQQVADEGANPTADDAQREVFDAIIAAWQAGEFNAPLTDELKRLVKLDSEGFRDEVAADAQAQGDPQMALRHPLALAKWKAALDNLLDRTWERARADSPTELGPLRADLYVLTHEEAFAILNARRFFAAVLQRRVEATRAIQRALLDTGSSVDEYLHPRQRLARIADERLIAARRREYDHIINRLLDYCTDDVEIDPEKLTRDKRGEVKWEIVTELRGGLPDSHAVREEPASDPLDELPGTRQQAAYALAVMDIEICHRSTIRAMLPAGTIRHLPNPAMRRREGKNTHVNRVSNALQAALKSFEDDGWIQRGEEFVRILDRQKLYDFALRDYDELPEGFIDYNAAESLVRSEVDTAGSKHPRAWLEQRHRELERLRVLMESAPVRRAPRVVLRTGRQERLEVGQRQRFETNRSAPVGTIQTRHVKAKPACSRCHGKPPAGFTCRTCGTDGTEAWNKQ